MASTFIIPLTTLPVGTRNLGPAAAGDAERSILLTIDRTVAGGQNSLTPASEVQADVMQSGDSGVTWRLQVGGTMPGGVLGNSSTLRVDLFPGMARLLRVTLTVSGPSPVAVAGSLVTT